MKLGPLKLSQSLLLLNTMKLLLEASWKISHVQNQVVSLDNLPRKFFERRSKLSKSWFHVKIIKLPELSPLTFHCVCHFLCGVFEVYLLLVATKSESTTHYYHYSSSSVQIIPPQCGIHANLHFLAKNFVKTAFLMRKSLKIWFDEIFLVRAIFTFFHTVPSLKLQRSYNYNRIGLKYEVVVEAAIFKYFFIIPNRLTARKYCENIIIAIIDLFKDCFASFSFLTIWRCLKITKEFCLPVTEGRDTLIVEFRSQMHRKITKIKLIFTESSISHWISQTKLKTELKLQAEIV